MTQRQQPGSGAQPVRRARWERYRVTHPFSPKALAGLWGAIIGIVALAALLGWALEMKGGVVIVAAIPFIASWFEKQRTAFQFDPSGVRVGEVLLPWSDVSQFVVATPQGGRQALLGVRLRPGAALPPHASVPPPHPDMPAHLHVAVQGRKFELAQMIRKARQYAPSQVQIVVADPSGERVAA
ncbi:hypothetical protein ACQB60_18935 [Actinomycetota bacterium Odt1-20B]